MHLFDTHFHYSGEIAPAEYRRFIMAEAAAAGLPVESLKLHAVSCTFEESLLAQSFARADADAVFAVGVQPDAVKNFTGCAADFECFADDPKLAAIGELGLDYYYAEAAPERQQQVLKEFLDLALRWNRPAVIHLRDKGGGEAYSDGLKILTPFAEQGGRFVVHCFCGTPEQMKRFLDLGGYIGVTGMVTFRKAENIRAAAELIPDDRLLIETDAPYLAPVPFRGKVNHPGLVGFVARELARVRGTDEESLGAVTTANAERFLNWKGSI